MPYTFTHCPLCGDKLDTGYAKSGKKRPLIDPKSYEKIRDTYEDGEYVWIERLSCKKCNMAYRYTIRAFSGSTQFNE